VHLRQLFEEARGDEAGAEESADQEVTRAVKGLG